MDRPYYHETQRIVKSDYRRKSRRKELESLDSLGSLQRTVG